MAKLGVSTRLNDAGNAVFCKPELLGMEWKPLIQTSSCACLKGSEATSDAEMNAASHCLNPGGFMRFSDKDFISSWNQLPPPLLEFHLGWSGCSQLCLLLDSVWGGFGTVFCKHVEMGLMLSC